MYAHNADFDGDQMAVHVPFRRRPRPRQAILMLSTNNILKPTDGKPVVSPTQDLVLGLYYLTAHVPGKKGEGRVFRDYNEMIMAYEDRDVELHAKVKVRMTDASDGSTGMVESTVGRFIFNEAIPSSSGLWIEASRGTSSNWK